MSGWITHAGIAKRRRGLYVKQASAAPSVATLRPTFASMTFSAIYLADHPGTAELGGTFDPATSGANVTLSNGDLTAAFAGIGSVLSTVNLFNPFVDTVWEVLYDGGWDATGAFSDSGGAYNGNGFMGGGAANGARLNANGTISAFQNPGAGGAPLVVGDIVGVWWQSSGAADLFEFYVNGISYGTGEADSSGSGLWPIVTHA